MRIVIIGAGLAGPLLAQGVQRHGHDVTLVERRPPVDHLRTGYRIHLDPQGELALGACLPARLHELAVLTSGTLGGGVRVLNTDLEVINELVVPQPADLESEGRHLTVDRQTLREILLAGLEDKIEYGVGFEGFRIADDGTVRVDLDNGSALTADLLVGADGSGSRLRQQLLPDLEVIDIGQVNIFGRTPLTNQTLPDIPWAALDGFSTVIGPDGRAMPLAAHRFANPPRTTAARLWPGLQLSADHDYLMWVFSLPAEAIPDPWTSTALQDFTADQVGRWQPSLRRIVRASETGSVQTTTVRTSRRPDAPWPSCPVTVIGDAAHPMIPAGIGAAVALADAAALAEQLAAVATGERDLITAVSRYERQMIKDGFDAVEQSERRFS
ncbi:FAD-dependent monooxygenase [Microlunatus elymi]|uniref:FAD-dependent monooxygenase n=1 Tax=Microlunatus elymi TaxID=2596828 RepID=A0A516PZ99_9ACTN|nr:FAD-dependent monooxygenase [Microlunatus elymi]QDP96490.1 FAD-dependent monooxygenase [Microlunatus elymi]